MAFGVINFLLARPAVYTIDAFWQTKSTPHNIPTDRIFFAGNLHHEEAEDCAMRSLVERMQLISLKEASLKIGNRG
jgi:hypothetical protein